MEDRHLPSHVRQGSPVAVQDALGPRGLRWRLRWRVGLPPIAEDVLKSRELGPTIHRHPRHLHSSQREVGRRRQRRRASDWRNTSETTHQRSKHSSAQSQRRCPLPHLIALSMDEVGDGEFSQKNEVGLDEVGSSDGFRHSLSFLPGPRLAAASGGSHGFGHPVHRPPVHPASRPRRLGTRGP